jgi:hypothetical protein
MKIIQLRAGGSSLIPIAEAARRTGLKISCLKMRVIRDQMPGYRIDGRPGLMVRLEDVFPLRKPGRKPKQKTEGENR